MNRIAGMVPDVDWKRPDDVVSREVDPESGMLATPYCPQTHSEIFVAGTEPAVVCPLHAGSGEPSPLWRDRDTFPGDQPPASPDQRRDQKKEHDKGIRRLLRIIFGNGQ
jgi:penicillin-binding protein 2D